MNIINSGNLLIVLNYLNENIIQYTSIDEFKTNNYTISFIAKMNYNNEIHNVRSSISEYVYNKILNKLKFEKL